MSGGSQPFLSTVAGSLDGKGRVCVPAAFRHILTAQATPGVYLCPSFVETAIEGFGQTLVDAVHQRLAQDDPFFSPTHDDRAGQILAETVLLPVDENGRIRVPEAMIAAARLKEKIVFIGMGQKFQIWDPEIYAPIKAERTERARADRLGAMRNSGGTAQ
jgi:MraZ protein